MHVRQLTKNHYEISNHKLNADIKMNPRDSMVMVNVTSAQADAHLDHLIEYLQCEVGGKIFIRIPEGMDTNEVQSKGATLFISPENIELAMREIEQKEKVANHFAKMATGEYKVWETASDYKRHYQELYEFKSTHGDSFVNQQKKDWGLYSAIAEEEKVRNEFVREFTLYDTKEKKIIATLQAFIHDGFVYFSDFIIHKEKQNQGLAQTIMLKAFQQLKNENKNLQGAWFIAGGDGHSPAGDRLYKEILRSEILNESLQNKLNVRTFYCPPKKLLLNAAHRSLQEPNNTLDVPTSYSSYVKKGTVIFSGIVAATAIGSIVYENFIKKRI